MDSQTNHQGRFYSLSPQLQCHRVVNGMWQVAGGHGYIDHGLAVDEMMRYHEAGFTTWDMADIYGPAEDFMGQFRRKIAEIKGDGELRQIRAFTKWVPHPGKITRSMAKESTQNSLAKMGVESLDLLQFHWWDYDNPYYVDALGYLAELCDDGLIQHLGLTNFDTERMQVIHDSNIPIVSNQVQYSIIDQRPEVKMIQFCEENNKNLFAYGTICGGLLSERYLGMSQEPSTYDLDTLSLQKYKKMVDLWGNWSLFQELLETLKKIGQKYNVDIANVATRYILEKPSVAGVIIGARLGVSEHIDSNTQVFGFSLDESDRAAIEKICSKSNNLFEIIGDCGDEYR
ncbi:aldo/keto reductase [Candidatus Nitrosocosmicus agrestis]|uniref:aldo/keto reductase n=1 Tax=Candidatus Nitrosocosmicus agrestis TaxID=2563600 RepID=UPI00122E0CB5|nr:aldo/keto reductase [Candidatus Nitrosocosmicus sp. SS]KAA2281262.1 aldo/keto reductase [Candidatus Nitrosocosmicus sp. SS]KAF0867946.1 aldo/keto reductase [Candidatus Nitrosocosmicus sp. SS]MDR4490543.1 aldo/keto reductase [Candidatus Nitrosocosmicus sp.]